MEEERGGERRGRGGGGYHDEALGRQSIIIGGVACLVIDSRVCDYHCMGMGGGGGGGGDDVMMIQCLLLP